MSNSSTTTPSTKTYKITQNDVTVLSITIDDPGGVYRDIQWDSRTGLVTAVIGTNSERIPIPYTGNACGKLSPEAFTATNIYAMDYNYWYY